MRSFLTQLKDRGLFGKELFVCDASGSRGYFPAKLHACDWFRQSCCIPGGRPGRADLIHRAQESPHVQCNHLPCTNRRYQYYDSQVTFLALRRNAL